MEHPDERQRGNVDDPIVPIVPIDFQPNDGKGKSFSLRLGWGHLLISVFLALSGSAAWFILTAKSVFIEVDPVTAEIEVTGGLAIPMGQRYMIREGVYDLSLRNEGYLGLDTKLFVTDQQSQVHPVAMQKLPGRVTVESPGLDGARVQIDGVDIGITPLTDFAVEAGDHQLTVSAERYLSRSENISVSGRGLQERFELVLDPAWAVVGLNSQPPGADVLIDGELVGTTPIEAEILQGEREVTVKLAGHKAWQDEVTVQAGEDFMLPTVQLVPADGLVFIRSNPSGAGVTVNGEFAGQTPVEVAVPPGRQHQLTLFKAGYNPTTQSFSSRSGQESELRIDLDPMLASVRVIASPEDAEVFVDGELRGPANQVLQLMAATQNIEIRRQGYVPYSLEFTSRPGLEQEIRVSLKSLEQQRLEQIRPVINTIAGQTLKLFNGGPFTMGASRREAGRRPNESLRNVVLEKPFYFSLYEVTNAEFKRFRPTHGSGLFRNLPLGLDEQPVVMVSWQDAALYCNWLSEQEGLPLFYQVAEGEVVGFNPEATGYRLPSEAEWAWIARTNGTESSLRFAWGDQLPPAGLPGNIADSSAQSTVGEVIYEYTDGYPASAPVGEFEPNFHGVYDMTGNVSEWVHDYYGSVGSLNAAEEIDPLGPEEGEYHSIRGSSWMDSSITELRLSFRDFGTEPQNTLGFRIARYLGEPAL